MATGQRTDPFKDFQFRVEIDGIAHTGFSECSGLGSEVEVIEYREGNEPARVRKIPGMVKYNQITLKRGLTAATDLWKWYSDVIKNGAQARKNISIILVDERGNDALRWNLTAAWPCKWEVSALNAKTNDVAIEELTLVCEGLELAT